METDSSLALSADIGKLCAPTQATGRMDLAVGQAFSLHSRSLGEKGSA